MKRRKFIGSIGKGSLLLSTFPNLSLMDSRLNRKVKIRVVTKGPKHHFFGYYGINPWNRSQTHLLGLEVEGHDHMPDDKERATVGLIDTKTYRFEKLTQTNAWNYQQGTMLHWNPLNPDSEMYLNDKLEGAIVTRKINIHTGKEDIIPWPTNALGHHGKYALSLNYGRLSRLRKVVGYSGVEDPHADDPCPVNDGIRLIDMITGKERLIVSFKEVYERLLKRGVVLKGAHLWFNHVVFNKSDQRFFFLARTRKEDGNLETGMFGANTDGSDLLEIIPYGYSVSHFDWRNDKEIVATFKKESDDTRKHYLLTDGQHDYQHLGEGLLDFDGHCVFRPDQQWIATDERRNTTDSYRQYLHLYNLETREFMTLADHDMKRQLYAGGLLRCDFHPRWNHTGDKICFDSIDQTDGTRQIHTVEVDV